jgi:hypothetical protein
MLDGSAELTVVDVVLQWLRGRMCVLVELAMGTDALSDNTAGIGSSIR